MKVNITMEDGSKLEKVNIFTSRNMGDSILSTRIGIEEFLNTKNVNTVYFGNRHIQGGVISSRIADYKIIDNVGSSRNQRGKNSKRIIMGNNEDLELDEIKIGSVIVTKEGNIYKILDFSLINEEYPIAILNVETDVIIQSSYNVDYMNLGGYIYIDKEEYILKVFN